MSYPLLKNKLPEAIKKVWAKSVVVSTFIFIVIGAALAILLYWLSALNGIWLWIVIAYFIIVVINAMIFYFIIPYRYNYFRYEITKTDLAFQKGFIFRSSTYVPIGRIQHVETEQGPFLRKENLMELSVHTSATEHHIAGLSVEDALALRAQIINLAKLVDEDE